MSSLKHVVKRRTHKERHQPAARQRLGLLEKHKDYVLRAKDYHKKENAIKKLHEKAFYKNPDEFAFGMIRSQVKGGRLTKNTEHLSQDALKLVDTQDERYVQHRRQKDEKAVEKAQASLHFLNVPRPAEAVHKIFVDEDDDEDKEDGRPLSSGAASSSRGRLQNFNLAKHFNTRPELMARTSNRPRLETLAKMEFKTSDEMANESMQSYRELLGRQERAIKLKRVEDELRLRSDLKTKGRRNKVQDATKDAPAQYKWFRQRKR